MKYKRVLAYIATFLLLSSCVQKRIVEKGPSLDTKSLPECPSWMHMPDKFVKEGVLYVKSVAEIDGFGRAIKGREIARNSAKSMILKEVEEIYGKVISHLTEDGGKSGGKMPEGSFAQAIKIEDRYFERWIVDKEMQKIKRYICYALASIELEVLSNKIKDDIKDKIPGLDAIKTEKAVDKVIKQNFAKGLSG